MFICFFAGSTRNISSTHIPYEWSHSGCKGKNNFCVDHNRPNSGILSSLTLEA
jgi:hypothetical protein